MKKIRNILTLALSVLFLAGFLLAAILTPDRTDSLSERRKLAQRPALRASAVADGKILPGELCPDCAEKALKKFRAAIAGSTLGEEELQYIDSVIEGDSLTDIAEGRMRHAGL